MESDWQKYIDTITRPLDELPEALARPQVPTLTVLAHPQRERVGETAALTDLVAETGETTPVARLTPLFAPVPDGDARPLLDPWLSRKPFVLHSGPDRRFRIVRGQWPGDLTVDGKALQDEQELDRESLDRGVVLLLAKRVALVLQLQEPVIPRPPAHGLVGESPAMVQLCQQISRVAVIPDAVLLRGESGTGKELVARALHEASPRHERPFIAVNAGAIAPNLVASDLFGAAAGAHSAARRERKGHFQRADGGTLFLDEIGEVPLEVQNALLRVLENGEVQPVGGRPYRVDVRVVTATDQDLEEALSQQGFKTALYHRLSTCTVFLPPLRHRRADIGRLFFHFLSEAEREMNVREPMEVPAERVADFALHSWPGNVRELRNLARQLAIFGLDARGHTSGGEPWPSGPLDEETAEHTRTRKIAVRSAEEPRYRDPATVREQELRTAFAAHRFEAKATAEALELSRTSVYELMKKWGIRTASQIGRAEIERTLRETRGGVRRAAERLEVSERALKQQMKKLGLS